MHKLIINQKGVTLLELMVSIGIFGFIIVMTAGIFNLVMDGQQSAIASQSTQESIRYAYEIMAKEIRTAVGSHTGSLCASGAPDFKVFNTGPVDASPETGDVLYFQNKEGDCVTYYLDDGAVWIRRRTVGLPPYAFDLALPITPDEMDVTNLIFYVKDDFSDAFHTKQPRVTFKMVLEPSIKKEKIKESFEIQTTVSSRFYE